MIKSTVSSVSSSNHGKSETLQGETSVCFCETEILSKQARDVQVLRQSEFFSEKKLNSAKFFAIFMVFEVIYQKRVQVFHQRFQTLRS